MRQICSLMAMIPMAWAFQPPSGASTNAQRLTAQSNFVFQGTVTRLNATTEPQVPASPSTALVRVENLIEGANMVSDVIGKEITVQLLKPRSVTAGRRVLFFSNVAVVGKSVVVKEVSHSEISRYNNNVANQAADYVRRKPEIELQRRVAGADLIVTGSVASVGEPHRQVPPSSEHDAEWTEATVDVQSTEKGVAPQRVTVWFPASRDIRWFRSPKFQTGQAGVFLLRRATDIDIPRENALQSGLPGFTALHPLDFQPLTEREHVKQLMARPR